MKKSLFALAFTLIAAGAHATDQLVTFEFAPKKDPGLKRSITTYVGDIAPMQSSAKLASGKCVFQRPFFEASIENTIEVKIGSSEDILVMPVESDDVGVKTLIMLTKQEPSDQKMVEITKGCTLPIGTSTTSSVNVVKILKFGVTEEIEFQDGAVWKVIATKQ